MFFKVWKIWCFLQSCCMNVQQDLIWVEWRCYAGLQAILLKHRFWDSTFLDSLESAFKLSWLLNVADTQINAFRIKRRSLWVFKKVKDLRSIQSFVEFSFNDLKTNFKPIFEFFMLLDLWAFDVSSTACFWYQTYNVCRAKAV